MQSALDRPIVKDGQTAQAIALWTWDEPDQWSFDAPDYTECERRQLPPPQKTLFRDDGIAIEERSRAFALFCGASRDAEAVLGRPRPRSIGAPSSGFFRATQSRLSPDSAVRRGVDSPQQYAPYGLEAVGRGAPYGGPEGLVGLLSELAKESNLDPTPIVQRVLELERLGPVEE